MPDSIVGSSQAHRNEEGHAYSSSSDPCTSQDTIYLPAIGLALRNEGRRSTAQQAATQQTYRPLRQLDRPTSSARKRRGGSESMSAHSHAFSRHSIPKGSSCTPRDLGQVLAPTACHYIPTHKYCTDTPARSGRPEVCRRPGEISPAVLAKRLQVTPTGFSPRLAYHRHDAYG